MAKSKKNTLSQKWEIVEEFITSHFKIRLNIVSCLYEYRKSGGGDIWRELNENEVYRIMSKNNISFSLSNLRSLLQSEFVSKYNPILEYFTEINSDISNLKSKIAGRNVILELCQFINVDDPKRFEIQFTKMLVRTIACALVPKVVNKQAFVFVDENQNSGKTTFLRWLMPQSIEKYYTENMTRDKDGLITLGSNLLINLDELSIFSKYEINHLKSIMSAESIKVRLPYGKSPVFIPRIASFIGSTNKTDFLQDETGSVRWICFQLSAPFNFDYKNKINIDELWLYAYQLYLDGYSYNLSTDEIMENEVANLRFKECTPELELLMNYFQSSNEYEGQFMQSTQITDFLIGQTNINLKPNMVGKALVQLKFARTQIYDKEKGFGLKGYWVKKIKE